MQYKVWYQNSRARERKGQFRQNMQIINKKCPYCVAIFKVKSALESHLQTKHPDNQPINVDQIPDVKQNHDEHSFKNNSNSTWSHHTGLIHGASTANIYGTNSALILNSADSSNYYWQYNNKCTIETPNDSLIDMGDIEEISYSADDSNTDYDDIVELNMTNAMDSMRPIQQDHIQIIDDHRKMSQLNNINTNTNNNDKDELWHEQKKRHRTSMNSKQLKILRALFHSFKTPNMIDCELVGKEIGLPKRVIQVGYLTKPQFRFCSVLYKTNKKQTHIQIKLDQSHGI